MPERLVSRSGVPLVERIVWLRSAAARMRGLVGRPQPDAGVALVLAPAVQVHTIFLRYPIDVALCDAGWRVLWVARCMPPNRVGPVKTSSRYAVEMRAGSLPDWIERGTELLVVE